jgi:phosphatidylserine/phosphatidylglycerophosphate/cardiolipin synthase-like enzyme
MDARDKWFLRPEERGNPDTEIDRRNDDGRAYTEGNRARPLVHGATYFRALHETLLTLEEGHWIHFTDWRGDPDELLAGPGTEVARVLADAARRGVEIRGLVWRSHPDQAKFSEQENLHMVETINEGGGEVLLDERVRKGGSHHQKLFLIRRPGNEDDDIAFVGGIDLCHSRNDDDTHAGDPQSWEMNDVYGDRPPWHDVQLEIRGPAVGDLAWTFRERWEDPNPLDRRNPLRALMAKKAKSPKEPGPLPKMPRDPRGDGSLAIQVLRTYPYKRRHAYPFARRGERSIARAYIKALKRVRRLVYVEDQYFWSEEVAESLAETLRATPTLRLIALVPLYPEQQGFLSETPERWGQQKALDIVKEAGGQRVSFYGVENDKGTPIYIHAKACVMDDVWAMVGSDNLNRRSWTHDSELSCAVLDDRHDTREPTDPAGTGDGARTFARDLRLTLWREHLGNDIPTEDILDVDRALDVWRESAERLERWKSQGRKGPRPPGRAVVHSPPRISRLQGLWADTAYRLFVDPDGRPRDLKKGVRF